jgi:hypothetical protein
VYLLPQLPSEFVMCRRNSSGRDQTTQVTRKEEVTNLDTFLQMSEVLCYGERSCYSAIGIQMCPSVRFSPCWKL